MSGACRGRGAYRPPLQRLVLTRAVQTAVVAERVEDMAGVEIARRLTGDGYADLRDARIARRRRHEARLKPVVARVEVVLRGLRQDGRTVRRNREASPKAEGRTGTLQIDQ